MLSSFWAVWFYNFSIQGLLPSDAFYSQANKDFIFPVAMGSQQNALGTLHLWLWLHHCTDPVSSVTHRGREALVTTVKHRELTGIRIRNVIQAAWWPERFEPHKDVSSSEG